MTANKLKPFTHAFGPSRGGSHPRAVVSGFFVCSIDNPQGGLANGPCLGCTQKEMRLLTSQRVNLLEVSQEQGKLGDGRVADVNSALEIESRPYGCSSPIQDG